MTWMRVGPALECKSGHVVGVLLGWDLFRIYTVRGQTHPLRPVNSRMRGRCGYCKRRIALMDDGTLRSHGYKKNFAESGRCEGSWELPEDSPLHGIARAR